MMAKAASRHPLWMSLAFVLGAVALQAVVLYAMGRVPICECGTVRLWWGVVNSPENSQQISDWYTFSHLIHGFLFYLLFRYAAPRASLPVRLAMALGVECAWDRGE